MKNARHEAIAPYVDDALRNGESFFPLKGSDDVKSLQKFVHKYAGKGKVKTYQNTSGELVILRLQEDPIASDFPFATLSATKANEWKHPIQVPYEFKVGDSGITACGESYVVLEEKKDGQLIVNVKSHGRWKIGLRNPDGTCVYDYPNKHRFALLPPVQTDLAIPPKPTRKCNFWVNIYENCVSAHIQKEDAKQFVDEKNALAIALPVTVEFTPII